MERKLKCEIMDVVAVAMREALAEREEQWLTGDKVQAHIGFMTENWMKKFGHLLPRERVEIVKEDETTGSKWVYPINRMKRMLANGELKRLVWTAPTGEYRGRKKVKCETEVVQ